VLEKAVISQANGTRTDIMPLLDCVADIQAVVGLDMDDDGTIGTYATPSTGALAGLVADAPPGNEVGAGTATLALVNATLADATLLRARLKEIRVYVLAHEGQQDSSFTYTTNPVGVGTETGAGRTFNFVTNGITNWANYRWKVYTIVVSPSNLGR
jgi:hypothetical protein